MDGVEVSPRAVLMKMVQQPVGNFLNETEESAAQPLTSVVGGGVVATGIINGKKMMLKTTFDPNFYNTAEERVSLFRRFGACNIYVSFPALVGAVLCIEGKVSHGVIGSECLLPQDFFGKCAEYGVDIELHESCREID